MLDLKCEIENNILYTKEKSNNTRIRRSVTVTVKFTMKKNLYQSNLFIYWVLEPTFSNLMLRLYCYKYRMEKRTDLYYRRHYRSENINFFKTLIICYRWIFRRINKQNRWQKCGYIISWKTIPELPAQDDGKIDTFSQFSQPKFKLNVLKFIIVFWAKVRKQEILFWTQHSILWVLG